MRKNAKEATRQPQKAGEDLASRGNMLSQSFVEETTEFQAIRPAIAQIFDDLGASIPSVSFKEDKLQRCVFTLMTTVDSFSKMPRFVDFRLVYPGKHSKTTLQQILHIKWCEEADKISGPAGEAFTEYKKLAYSKSTKDDDISVNMSAIQDSDGLLINKLIELSFYDDEEKQIFAFREHDARRLLELFACLRRLSDGYSLRNPEKRLSYIGTCVWFNAGEAQLFDLRLEGCGNGFLQFLFVNKHSSHRSFVVTDQVSPPCAPNLSESLDGQEAWLKSHENLVKYETPVILRNCMEDKNVSIFLTPDTAREMVLLSESLLESYSVQEIRHAFNPQ